MEATVEANWHAYKSKGKDNNRANWWLYLVATLSIVNII